MKKKSISKIIVSATLCTCLLSGCSNNQALLIRDDVEYVISDYTDIGKDDILQVYTRYAKNVYDAELNEDYFAVYRDKSEALYFNFCSKEDYDMKLSTVNSIDGSTQTEYDIGDFSMLVVEYPNCVTDNYIVEVDGEVKDVKVTKIDGTLTEIFLENKYEDIYLHCDANRVIGNHNYDYLQKDIVLKFSDN